MKKREGNVIFEFIPQGNFVKVSAIDPHTGIEAVIVGSVRMNEKLLAQAAARKLRYLLEKE